MASETAFPLRTQGPFPRGNRARCSRFYPLPARQQADDLVPPFRKGYAHFCRAEYRFGECFVAEDSLAKSERAKERKAQRSRGTGRYPGTGRAGQSPAAERLEPRDNLVRFGPAVGSQFVQVPNKYFITPDGQVGP